MGLPTPARYRRARLSGSPSERALNLKPVCLSGRGKTAQSFQNLLPVSCLKTASASLSELPRQATI